MMWRQPWEKSSVEVPANGYDYIIYTDGTNVYAKNGESGRIEYKVDDAGDIVEKILQDNDSVHIHFTKGEFLIDPKRLFLQNSNGADWVCGILIDGKVVTITGEGIGQTVLKLNPQTNTYGNIIGAKNYNYLKIADLTLDGNKDAVTLPSSTDGHGATLLTGGYDGTDVIGQYEYRSGLILHNVKFQNSAEQGAYLGYNNGGIEAFANLSNIFTENNGAEGLHVDRFHFVNLTNFVSKNDGHGLLIYTPSTGDLVPGANGNISNVSIYNTNGTGIIANYTVGLKIVNVTVYNAEEGIWMRSVNNNSLINANLTNISDIAINTNPSSNTTIEHIRISGAKQGIYLGYTLYNVSVRDIYIENANDFGLNIQIPSPDNCKSLLVENVWIDASSGTQYPLDLNRVSDAILRNVRVVGATGNDALAVFNYISNVVFENCYLQSDQNAVNFAVNGPNVVFRNCTLDGGVNGLKGAFFLNSSVDTSQVLPDNYVDNALYTSLPDTSDSNTSKVFLNRPIHYYDGTNYYIAVWDGSAWRKVQLS